MESPVDKGAAATTEISRTVRRRLNWGRKLLFSAVAFFVFFGSMELGLRIAGFHFEPSEPSIWSDGQMLDTMLRYSSAGMWEPIPGAQAFNSDGFLGPPIPVERVPGALRVATLGDSCTHLGEPPYSELLREKLQQRLGRSVEVLNAGVGRYSTEQGIARFEEKVKPYRPDVVTIYFGWNDHWRDPAQTDASRMANFLPLAATRLRSFQASRVVQAIVFVADTLHDYLDAQIQRDTTRVFRVPPERYVANLRRLIDEAKALGAQPILITAPTTAEKDVPHWGAMLQGWRDTPYKSHREIHDAYVELTRQVATETRTPLVDARKEFSGRTSLMMSDQIHLNPAGHALMADLLADKISTLAVAGAQGKSPQIKSPIDAAK